jgi:Pyruvate/2-oxoacid:ferredoxin oxidoreductase delta subunit
MKDRGDHYEANLDFCKGCGICARECPKQAYTMVPEGEFVK